MFKKPTAFWILFGILLVGTLLLTVLPALRLYPAAEEAPVYSFSEEDAAAAAEALKEDKADKRRAKQFVSLALVGVFACAVFLELPFALMASAAAILLSGLFLRSFLYALPLAVSAVCVILFLHAKVLAGPRDGRRTLHYLICAVLLHALVHFLFDFVAALGYRAACVSFVSHLLEGIVCAAAGYAMLYFKKGSLPQQLGTVTPGAFAGRFFGGKERSERDVITVPQEPPFSAGSGE